MVGTAESRRSMGLELGSFDGTEVGFVRALERMSGGVPRIQGRC